MKPLAALALAVTAFAQQQQPVIPHIGYIYPAGGRQGASLEITIGGQNLTDANQVYITGSGVQVSVSKYTRPLTPGQAANLRDQLKMLTDKRAAASNAATAKPQPSAAADRVKPGPPAAADGAKPESPAAAGRVKPEPPAAAAGAKPEPPAAAARAKPEPFTAADARTVMEIQMKLAEFQRRPLSPAIAETVLVEVTIAADAPPGERELRLAAQPGLTNPLTFTVGQLPEFSRKPAKVPAAFVAVNGAIPPNRPLNRPVEPPMEVTLPAVINGQTMPATSDQYRFHATRGTRLVAAVRARELIPYISDAVPGWFQAAITLRDPAGKEVAYADHFRFHQDPVIYYEVPADGDYLLEIRDSIYRGREDFVYRITLGELPYLTGIFPMGGRAGARGPVRVSGWNLPDAGLAQDPKVKAGDTVPISVRSRAGVSNSVPFAVDSLPEVLAQVAANRREKAQRVKLPVIVNGRIEHPGDSQYFRFDGHAGEEIVSEVMARRLGSPLDSVLRLTDASGKELAFNDDFDDKGAGLLTHQADSFISVKLPANGTYYLQLGDTQRHGGAEYAYRLRIGPPRPDFELRVAPSSINLRGGGTLPVTVYALRRDGFSGDIALQLKDAPAGFTLSGAVIPGGQDKVRLTLTAPRGQVNPRLIQLEGHAEIPGRKSGAAEVRHIAVPAEDMMQAFAYRHLVAEKEWMVRVNGPGAGVAVRPVADRGLKLVSGGTAPLQVFVPERLMDGMVLLLNDPPEGISIQEVRAAPNGMSLLLHADAKVAPGLKGNLILDAFMDRIVTPQNGTPTKRRALLGTLPAVPFEVTK